VDGTVARKSKITVRRTGDLEAVDAELDTAMSDLDATNERVADLLQSYAPEEPEEAEAVPQDGAVAGDEGGGPGAVPGSPPAGSEGTGSAE